MLSLASWGRRGALWCPFLHTLLGVFGLLDRLGTSAGLLKPALLGAYVPLLGALVPLLGALVWVPLLGAPFWVPLLGAPVPLLGAPSRP